MVMLRLPVSCDETSIDGSPPPANINTKSGLPSVSPTRVNVCSQQSVASGDTAAQRTAQLTTCCADFDCCAAQTYRTASIQMTSSNNRCFYIANTPRGATTELMTANN